MARPPVPAAGRRSEMEVVGRLRQGGPALVALSGGVDSSLVAALAVDALGASARAATLAGPAVARTEVERARRVADYLGIAHDVLRVDPVEDPEYRANPNDRCYYCRRLETGVLRTFGAPRGMRQFLDGVHLDDLSDVRPGLRAMDEAGFVHPLVWARWTKADVRDAAHRRGLPNWDEPSDACLASRVAHGEPISHELLERIDAAETLVRARGFRRVRVRVRGGAARIEVDPGEVARLSAEPLAEEITEEVRRVGFERVTIDPLGYGRTHRSELRVL